SGPRRRVDALRHDDVVTGEAHPELVTQEALQQGDVLLVEHRAVDREPLDAGRVGQVLALHPPVDATPRLRPAVDPLAVREVGEYLVRRGRRGSVGNGRDGVVERRLARVRREWPDPTVVFHAEW